MLQAIPDQPKAQTQIISTLSRLRQEWQEATDGASLLETDGNIGLILADLVNGFELNASEQSQILGNELFHELKDFMFVRKQN